METDRKYTIAELAGLTGVSRRTVRFYVQRGLVPAPLGAGRGHYYTEDHLTRIRAIRQLQEHGLSLEEIEGRFRGKQPGIADLVENTLLAMPSLAEPAGPAPPEEEEEREPALWLRLPVGAGAEINIESGNYRLSPGRLKKLRKAVKDILGPGYRALKERERSGGE